MSDVLFIMSLIRKFTVRRTGFGGAAAELVASTNLSICFGGDGDDGFILLGVDVLGLLKVKIMCLGL